MARLRELADGSLHENARDSHNLNLYANIAIKIREQDDVGAQAFLAHVSNSTEVGSYLDDAEDFGDLQRKYYRIPFISDLMFEYIKACLTTVAVDVGEGEGYNRWPWSYATEAALHAYERTGEERFLKLTESAIESAIRQRDCDLGRLDEVRGRVLASWGTPDADGRWTNLVATAGRIVNPIAYYLEICRQTGRPFPEAWLQACVACADEFHTDFVVSRDGDEGLYRRPAKGDWEPLNHALSMGRALLRLGRLTGETRYLDTARRLSRFVRRSLVEEDGAFSWGYRPNMGNRTRGFPTLFWKADVDLAFIVDSHLAGIEFDSNDIARFAETFKRGVLRSGVSIVSCR